MNINIGEMQRKLSLWAERDKERRFYGLFDLICKLASLATSRKRGYSIRGRAVCSESCMYGSEGGVGKRTGRLAVSTAPVPLPYWGHFGYSRSAAPGPQRRRALSFENRGCGDRTTVSL